jgi:hypothetical protein
MFPFAERHFRALERRIAMTDDRFGCIDPKAGGISVRQPEGLA